MKLPATVNLALEVWLRLAAEAHRRNLTFTAYLTAVLGAEADRVRREAETVAAMRRALEPWG